MPSIFSHAVASSALAYALTREPLPPRFWALAAVCSVIPDLDVLGFVIGIPYGSVWGHRGFSHSLLFGVLCGAALAMTFLRLRGTRHAFKLAVVLALATLTHAAFDSLTNGGLGVALLAPVSADRYFAPWRPIEVSPIGTAFFSARGARVLASEIAWVWFPSFVLVGIGWAQRRWRSTATGSRDSAPDE
jgi:inner membrane protein